MKIEKLRERLFHEQLIYDEVQKLKPGDKDSLLLSLKPILDCVKTREGQRVVDFDFDQQGNVILINAAYWTAGPFLRITLG